MRHIIYITLSICVLISACKSSTFSGTNPEKAIDKTITVGCNASPQQVNVTGNKTSISVSGQLCLRSDDVIQQGQVNIMFIVDESNSMRNADPSGLLGLTGCGRRQAINAVVNKIKSDLGGYSSGSAIRLGTITFSDNASGGSLSNLNSFNAFAVCGSNGGTNYEAAFDLARQRLSSIGGQNIIYFLTDGAPSVSNSPTTSGNDWLGGRDGAIRAMNNLRSSVSNLMVNTIYLRDTSSSPGSMPPYDTYNLLVNLTGDSNRVREVSQASSLANEIVNFETPNPQSVSASSFSAQYLVGSSIKATPSIRSFTQTSANVYTYTLAPVKIDCSNTSQSRIRVSGRTNKGETITSEVVAYCTRTSN